MEAARKMADAIGVRKSIANLTLLESASTKRKAEDFPLGKNPRQDSPPPTKAPRTWDDDEISLDWGSDLDEEIVTVAGLNCKQKSLAPPYSVSDDSQLPTEVDSWSPMYNKSPLPYAFAVIDDAFKKHK